MLNHIYMETTQLGRPLVALYSISALPEMNISPHALLFTASFILHSDPTRYISVNKIATFVTLNIYSYSTYIKNCYMIGADLANQF